MSIDGLWIGQVAMAALMNVAFAFAVGSALLAAWLAKDAQQKISPASAGCVRNVRC
jgi:putative copper resistance protein D